MRAQCKTMNARNELKGDGLGPAQLFRRSVVALELLDVLFCANLAKKFEFDGIEQFFPA